MTATCAGRMTVYFDGIQQAAQDTDDYTLGYSLYTLPANTQVCSNTLIYSVNIAASSRLHATV